MLDVCICTHNPRIDVLSLVLQSLVRQDVGTEAFRVIIIDNASYPTLPHSMLEPLRKVGLDVRLLQEPVLGVSRARLRAVRETNAYWVLFVDDDNELSASYISRGLAFIKHHPEIGCFGGKLLLARNLNPPRWAAPFLPYLGIKDIGEETLIGRSENWEHWEPPTAGAFVCRPLLDEYLKQSMQNDEVHQLGRQGRNNLASCEDSLIMRNAFRLNLSNAYHPVLMLHHHLDPKRFRFRYLVRLLYGYGRSHVMLESILKGRQAAPIYYANIGAFFMMLIWRFIGSCRHSVAFAIGQVAYSLGARHEYLKEGTTVQGRDRGA